MGDTESKYEMDELEKSETSSMSCERSIRLKFKLTMESIIGQSISDDQFSDQ